MRDPNYRDAWSDSLALRISFEATDPLSEARFSSSESSQAEEAFGMVMPTGSKFTRSSSEGFDALSRLSTSATILLFTPVLIPAGDENAESQRDGIDPFEAFGRALSQHHKRIRHVPYVPKTGYTETHAAFISQADVIITVICEPERDKDWSISRQMEFSMAALHNVEGKEANASTMLVLFQSGSEQCRIPVTASFKTVIEVASYNDEIAKQLAQAIFKFRR